MRKMEVQGGKGRMRTLAALSAAVMLSVVSSMTARAADGWQTVDGGGWRYYEQDSAAYVTNEWRKSGEDWYWLGGDGVMAVSQLVEDKGNLYYVDENGVMVRNQWVAVENENAGAQYEPEQWWYYFQGSGKALKGPESGRVSLKKVGDKKYAFDTEGRMLYGWIEEDNAGLMTDDEEAWRTGDYYFGDENDGAVTLGWIRLEVRDDEAGDDTWVNPAFSEEQDQERWFYFKTNGKKIAGVRDDSGNTRIKEKYINGMKYGFDEYGRMLGEWSYDYDRNASPSVPVLAPDFSGTEEYQFNRAHSRSWMYFRDVEDGRKMMKGWFKVVPSENLNPEDYEENEEGWYYTDGNGHLYAGEFKTIGGKKYAFDSSGRMLTGLRFLELDSDGRTILRSHDEEDDEYWGLDTEESFDYQAGMNAAVGAGSWGGYYYFGGEDDGEMRTGRQMVELDGEIYPFYFKESGSRKGNGLVGEKDNKFYNSGKLMYAGKDEKYQVIASSDRMLWEGSYAGYRGYQKLSDFEALKDMVTYLRDQGYPYEVYEPENWDKDDPVIVNLMNATGKSFEELKSAAGLTSSNPDKYGEIVVYTTKPKAGASGSQTERLGLPNDMEDFTIRGDTGISGIVHRGIPGFAVVDTSGKQSKKNARVKDGDGVYYKLYNGRIIATYIED